MASSMLLKRLCQGLTIAGLCPLLLACEQTDRTSAKDVKQATKASMLLVQSRRAEDKEDVKANLSAELTSMLSSSGASNRPHGAYDPHKKLTPQQHIRVALQHKVEGRMPLAIESLTQALASSGEHFQLLAVRSSLFLESGNLSAALADLNAALDIAPKEPGLLVNRAEVYRQFGRKVDALLDLDRAILIDDRMVAAYFNRGTLHLQNSDYEKALADFTRCTEISPHTAGPYFNRAAVHDGMGKRPAAIADIRRFMELTKSESWHQKAEALLNDWESPETSGVKLQTEDESDS